MFPLLLEYSNVDPVRVTQFCLRLYEANTLICDRLSVRLHLCTDVPYLSKRKYFQKHYHIKSWFVLLTMLFMQASRLSEMKVPLLAGLISSIRIAFKVSLSRISSKVLTI